MILLKGSNTGAFRFNSKLSVVRLAICPHFSGKSSLFLEVLQEQIVSDALFCPQYPEIARASADSVSTEESWNVGGHLRV